ncbi:MAG: SIMPL domain-containing protein [Clostridia bacterium]|nr:SIMPL domain-containing protein [Clostridia bacterium]
MQYPIPSSLANPYPYHQPAAASFQGCANPLACKMKLEGKGSIKVQPDMAVVTLGVSTENIQLSVAQEENAQKITDIINTLKRLGIPSKDIQTQNYSISPQYDYIEGKQVLRGYRVLHTLRVTIKEVDKIGQIIDEAVASGANIIDNIDFTVSDPSRYYKQALNAAIEEAISKAVTIGKKLRVNVSEVPVQVIEEGYKYAAPLQPVMLNVADAVTPIQSGQIDITARIEAVFAYTPL